MGGKTIVVFERLYLNDNCVAAHEDPEDEGQSIHIPGISTKAENKENGLRTGAEGERLTLVDTVTFCNLIPGQTYVLKGEWMDAAAKKSTGIRKELSFCPDQPNGSVEMIFDADASLLMGKTLVAFECLYDGDGNLIAKHCAYDDRDQTIAVRASTPATGDETETGLQCVIAILSAAALISLAVIAGKIRNACR